MVTDGDDPFYFEVSDVLKNTGAALLVVTDDMGEQWIPISQIHDDSEVEDVGDSGVMAIKHWLAVDRGWADPDE